MLKLFMKKSSIYFIFTMYLGLLSSCDSSTAPAAVPETLKDNIYGKWLVSRTCTKSYGACKVGDKDFQEWKITKRNDRIILVVNDSDGEGEWRETENYPFMHWAITIYTEDLTTNLYHGTEVELTSFNPLKGTSMDYVVNPETNQGGIIARYAIEGKRQ